MFALIIIYLLVSSSATKIDSQQTDDFGSMLSRFIPGRDIAGTIDSQSLIHDGFNLELESVPTAVEKASNFDNLQSSCQLVQILHLLHQTGCQPKAITSFACSGTCPSYVQISSSKFWQHERSCSCCQQTGVREATFTLDCPGLSPPHRQVKTYAPVDCMCRACTDLKKENLQPQELIEALNSYQN